MGDVSCRVSVFTLEALRKRGIDTDMLLAGTGLSAQALSDPNHEIAWDEFLCLLDRIEERGGVPLLEALGADILDFMGNRPLRAIARFAWTEQQFWRQLTTRIGPGLYRMVVFELEDLDDGSSRMSVRIPPAYRESENFLHLLTGVMRAIPRLLGGSNDSDMELSISPRLGVAILRPSMAPGIVARSLRAIGGLLLGDPAMAELERRHRSAADKTAQLETRDRSLAMLRAVADSITQSVDFAHTAQRIVDAVIDDTDYTAVTLYTLSENREALELAAMRTPFDPSSIPRSMPIDRGALGRALQERRVVWATDWNEHGDLQLEIQQRMREHGMRSFAIVPLCFHDRVIGTLSLASPQRRSLSPDGQASLLTLGKTAAAALMGARHVARIEREVEERRLVERELRRSEEHLRQVAENVHGIFYLLDAATDEVLYLSPNFERITGHSSEAIWKDARALFEMIHPDDRERVARVAGETGDLHDYEVEYRMVRPDGSVVDVLERSSLVREASGEPVRIAGFAQDITEMRELERQLRHTQKMEAVGRLAGGIAHDFNNLLTVILGYSALLRDRFEPGDADREVVDEIERAAESASGLTQGLLALARKQPVRMQNLDLGALVEGLAPMLRSLIGENVQLDLDLGSPVENGETRLVRGDRSQLEQVLVNLAVNARDAMPDGGTLSVGVRGLASGGVALRVRDTGVGMEPDVKARAFEPFFSTKGPGRGTGLGLAIVHGIIEQAGGQIALTSAPDVGSCVEIELPPAQGVASPSAPTPSAASQGEELLLLVEDQDDVRRVTARTLRGRGYRVIEARDAFEALKELEGAGAQIDLLLTDVVMPGMSGIELAAQVADRLPKVPVLFMSGYTGDDTKTAAAGVAEAILAKPFTPRALSAAVRERLDAAAAAIR